MNNLKKYLYISYLFIIIQANTIFADTPKIISDVDDLLPSDTVISDDVAKKIGGSLVETMIQYVTILAVIALMISGIMYLLSGGEEEKVKKAKNWIIWSLAGVLISISAMGIIKIINNIYI